MSPRYGINVGAIEAGWRRGTWTKNWEAHIMLTFVWFPKYIFRVFLQKEPFELLYNSGRI